MGTIQTEHRGGEAQWPLNYIGDKGEIVGSAAYATILYSSSFVLCMSYNESC